MATKEQARGTIFGTFIGDALGAPFEGWALESMPADYQEYLASREPRDYTDDTQMTISVLEELTENGEIRPESLQQRLYRRFDPQRGYGSGFFTLVKTWEEGLPVAASAQRLFRGQGSYGNGAAMRVAPVALFFHNQPQRLLGQARAAAQVTHWHRLGIDGASLQAAAVSLALNRVRFSQWPEQLLNLNIDITFKDRVQLFTASNLLTLTRGQAVQLLGNSVTSFGSVPLAIFSVLRSSSFAEAVSFAVACGGDTDTIGAMAGAIAGAWYGYGQIPGQWLKSLENGPEGKEFICSLVEKTFH